MFYGKSIKCISRIQYFECYIKTLLHALLQVLQLAHLNLADNLMGKIPFVPLSHVKSLKSLDMSSNRIIKIEGRVGNHRNRDIIMLSE